MPKKRPAGDGMVRQKKRGQWEARIVVGHKDDGKPIYRYVYGKAQKEVLDKLHQRIEDYRRDHGAGKRNGRQNLVGNHRSRVCRDHA